MCTRKSTPAANMYNACFSTVDNKMFYAAVPSMNLQRSGVKGKFHCVQILCLGYLEK